MKNSNKINLNKKAGRVELSGRLWLDKDNKNFLGIGKVVFLEKIKEYGSISKAAASEKMSYSKAWKLVDSMNSLSEEPLVIRKTGGSGGGGAELTEEGERIVQLYWDICREFEEFMEKQEKLLEKF